MARLLLHGAIDHIQTSWVKLGAEGSGVMLRGGANDLGGTLMEETISRMAGSEHGSRGRMAELEAMRASAGRPARAAHHRRTGRSAHGASGGRQRAESLTLLADSGLT